MSPHDTSGHSQVYKVTILYEIGNHGLNSFISHFDLGFGGMYVGDSVSFKTTSKPTKKTISRYEKGILDIGTNRKTDVRNIKVLWEII